MGVVQEYLNYLQECEGTDAADENEIVNGGDPESSLDAKDNIEDELLGEEFDLEEEASEYNEISNGDEPDSVDQTFGDIQSQLSKI